MTDRDLMQQALDALYDSVSDNSEWIAKRECAVKALRDRLAQPEQESIDEAIVDRRVKVKMGHWYGYDLEGHWFYLQPSDEHAELALEKHTGSRRRTHMTDRELMIDCPRCGHCCPQRPWVGLTPEERKECIDWATDLDGTEYSKYLAKMIEHKLKEKNGG